ncbi:hypothetical protein K466DRAFT_310372 [Polyporus arcularius HHB13444]|uniref:DUF6534 domain-containing protein n=1 Tax=Polyporus arcularius HHB13444 TaxID=1314778 RepID=A0A5C3PZK3_9APHY|nr:hypothetical protein K466DRAFT_310372 [Polyporus arcularius HHB13444]
MYASTSDYHDKLLVARTSSPSLDETYGAYLLGTFVATVLYGISVHQLYRYFRQFSTDTVFIRCLVYLVMILETVHTALNMHTSYYYLVTNYFDPAVLRTGIWSLIYAPILIGLVTLISQLFFARRGFLIGSTYRTLTAVAMIFYLVELGFSIAAIYVGATISSISDLATVTHLVAASFGGAVVGDAFLAGVLIYVIRHSRRNLKRCGGMFELLSIYGINTGLVHGFLNVAALVFALALPSALIHSAINLIATRVYANTLLAVLNSRQLTVGSGIHITNGTSGYGMNIISRANRLAAQERWNVPQAPKASAPEMIDITVTTEVEGDMSAKDLMRSESCVDIEE